jgi:NAD(P)-dependent dehydrogenase (short-subunit alcohol dehydrogenase family)
VAKLSLRYLKGTPSSSLTFTGGHISENPMPNYTIFTTYAAGLIGMVRNLALDMAPRRVNLVSVGSAITEMWGPNREQIAEVVGKINLLGKVARPEEVAEAFTYLMKDWNATGSVVSSNGGSLLQ